MIEDRRGTKIYEKWTNTGVRVVGGGGGVIYQSVIKK